MRWRREHRRPAAAGRSGVPGTPRPVPAVRSPWPLAAVSRVGHPAPAAGQAPACPPRPAHCGAARAGRAVPAAAPPAGAPAP